MVWALRVDLQQAERAREELRRRGALHAVYRLTRQDSHAVIPLRHFVEDALELDDALFKAARKGRGHGKYELYGQVLLVKSRVELDAASFPSIKLVLLKESIQDDGLRSPRVTTLARHPSYCGYASAKQNGITYTWDPYHTMFCPGNISEKLRISRIDMQGESVLDLYAGIGYWTLPMLKHCRARRVTACDWNEHSVRFLRHNLQLNKVEDGRCIVLEGDNGVHEFAAVFDRVILGLLPSSRPGWPIALRALRRCGVSHLHIHENVRETELSLFQKDMLDELRSLLPREEGRCWSVAVEHIECVKSYSPHVNHYVFDVSLAACSPSPASACTASCM